MTTGHKISESELEYLVRAFPKELKDLIAALTTKLDITTVHSIDTLDGVTLNGETIHIPNRVYWKSAKHLVNGRFTDVEKLMLNSILTRHDNGFIRQPAVKRIINSNHYWTTPYLLLSMGDYVIEILNDNYLHFDSINTSLLRSCIKENPMIYTRISSRIQSCRYRAEGTDGVHWRAGQFVHHIHTTKWRRSRKKNLT